MTSGADQDVDAGPYVIGRTAKITALGLIGELARTLEESWPSVDLRNATRDELNDRLAKVSDQLLAITGANGTASADLVLLNAVNRAVASRSWNERRNALLIVAAQALNWHLAGDRAARVPRMPGPVPS